MLRILTLSNNFCFASFNQKKSRPDSQSAVGTSGDATRDSKALISLSQYASPEEAIDTQIFRASSSNAAPLQAATTRLLHCYSCNRESHKRQLVCFSLRTTTKMGFDKFASKKRRREPYNVDVKLVEIYEDLASEKDEIRLRAAQGLVSQFTPDKNPTDEQIKKTLQRLFRGLCSSRKAARIGFSIALTEALTQIFSAPRESAEFGIADALKIWESQSNSSGSETGQVR